jgi:D-glycero-alpha-D-manno-heptose 1-phosphate guanylyltransferase
MVKDVIILAGGLGTRLSETVPGVQKCMAPVNGHPFLYYIIKYLQRYNLNHYIFSLGYRHENITDFISTQFSGLQCSFSIEDSPLGTGGAIRKALDYTTQKNILVLNGDTFFNVDIPVLSEMHEVVNADCTIALKPMQHFNRYGCVDIDETNLVVAFKEKQAYAEGLINGGIYMLSKEALLKKNLPLKFSFETDYLEKFVSEKSIYAQVHDEYFIDIGIPEDYFRAQEELKQFI